MSARTSSLAPRRWRHGIAAGAAIVTLAASLALAAPISAQDGTSGAPPLEETSCVLVPAADTDALLAGTDTAPVLPTPAASPVAVASPGASPVAAEPIAFDAELLTENLTATTTSLASCLSEGRFDDAADRTSPLFRGQLVGDSSPLQATTFVALASTFPATDYQIVEIDNVALVDERTASADVIWQIGHQVRVDRWTFVRARVQGIEMWVIDRAEPGTLEPSREAAEIEVTISENRYALEPRSVSGDAVEFRVTNEDAVLHELLVLRLDEGVSTDTLLTTPGPELPEGVTFIGQATIAPNASGGLLLSDLEPGTYTIVDMLPNAEGLPHLAAGMTTTFEIEGEGSATPAA